jgi:hypothetical protein
LLSVPSSPDRIRIGVSIRDWRKLAQHLVPRHVGQVEVEKDQVVVVELGEVDPLPPPGRSP